MAQTWINHKTNQVEIRGDVDDPELAEVAIQAGYCNAYNRGLYDVVDEIQAELPAGFRVATGSQFDEEAPENSIRIGQVKVHHGDPAFPLYVVRKVRGRPAKFGEKMKQVGVWMPEEMITWLQAQPEGISETIRALIQQAMKTE